MSKLPRTGRIKARYNPQPNAAEQRHEARVKEHRCFGCGRFGVSAHHTMLEFPAKRWRRDHRYLLPVCWDCHQGPDGIHGRGRESKWLASVSKTEAEAIAWIEWLWAESVAIETRKDAA